MQNMIRYIWVYKNYLLFLNYSSLKEIYIKTVIVDSEI